MALAPQPLVAVALHQVPGRERQGIQIAQVGPARVAAQGAGVIGPGQAQDTLQVGRAAGPPLQVIHQLTECLFALAQ